MLAKLRRAGSGGGGGEAVEIGRLVERHFALQDERPAHLQEVEIEDLDPFLRSLLFTDGTVTRALAVQSLAPVSVTRLGQSPTPLPRDLADCLEIERGEEAVRRRVGIGVGSAPIPVLWAESHLLPDRLPIGFLSLLEGAPDGIGQSLQRVALENYRELLWFGLDSTPEWAPAAAAAGEGVLQRLYRVVNDGQPAILISESFALERRAGAYCLFGWGDAER